jgi:DNA-binding transcriptional MerR regulator
MTTALASALSAKGKSPEAFRTISEVSVELDVPQHVLRFWETRFAQVRPIKRAGGRRFYRPEDVALLRGIRSLLYSDGYTIKGVQKVLRDKGWRHVAELGRSLDLGRAAPWNALDEDAAHEEIADTLADPPRVSEVAGDIPTGARAAMARLMRAHTDAADKISLVEHKRVRLELLLAELLVLRDRLRSARPRA